jgi:beta-galactosidase
MAEVHHVHRPVRFHAADAAAVAAGRLEVENAHGHIGLRHLRARWELTVDGAVTQRGTLTLPDVPAGRRAPVRLKVKATAIPAGSEAHLVIRCLLARATAWAPAGHVVSIDQLALPVQDLAPASMPGAHRQGGAGARAVVRGEQVTAGPATVTLDPTLGTVAGLSFHGRELLSSPLLLTLSRSRIDNDGQEHVGLSGPGRRWTALGLRDLTTTVTSWKVGRRGADVVVRSEADVRPAGSPAAARHRRRLTITADGVLCFDEELLVPVELADLPRIGVVTALAPGFEHLEWFGRGPHESYPDRKAGAPVGRYRSTVTEQYVPYLNPQEHGHHTDTRWCALHDGSAGVLVTGGGATPLFGMAARHTSDAALDAAYDTTALVMDDRTWLHVDHRMRGLGTASCGPDTALEYRIAPGRHRWRWTVGCFVVGGADLGFMARRRSAGV